MPINDIYVSPLRRPFPESMFSISKIKDWYSTYVGKRRSPEGDMLCFYYLHESVTELEKKYKRYTDLGDNEYIVQQYIESGLTIGEHILIYLLFICLRETRHVYKNSKHYDEWKKDNTIIIDLIDTINSTSSSDSIKLAANYLNKLKLSSITLLESISSLFISGCFSSACGGQKWKAISQLLLDYMMGTLTLEMLIDLSFNLEHNTSNIFNKGFMYNYSQNIFSSMLDMQHNGDIAMLVKHCPLFLNKYIPKKVVSMLEKCEILFPLCSSSFDEVSIKYAYLKKYIPKSSKVYAELHFPILGDLSIVKR